jgi:predicted nucleotidyltransferase
VSEQAIEERTARFKSDALKLSASSVVDRHIIFGDCYILNKDSYFQLKERIADRFRIHPPQVVMVGSGKLGFSIAPPKRYRSFGETSDLDIAIVAPNLFDRIWEEVFKARGMLGYWPGEVEFSNYLARGWIRPDKLPPARKFETANEWWTFFDALAASGDFGRYRIRGGLYRDWTFLKGYQTLAVTGCKEDLEATALAMTALGAGDNDVTFAASGTPTGTTETVAAAETVIAEIDTTAVVAEGRVQVQPVDIVAPERSTHENDRDQPKA